MPGILVALFMLIVPPLSAQSIDYIGSSLWSNATRTFIVGDYSYSILTNGMIILDVSVPEEPAFVSFFYIRIQAEDVAVGNGIAYVVSDDSSLILIDVSDPAHPSEIRRCELDRPPTSIYIRDDYAYLGMSSGVEIYDISDPDDPVYISLLTLGSPVEAVYARWGYVYLADGNAGLKIVNATNPLQPTLLSTYQTSGSIHDVDVAGDYAYLANEGRLLILRISNPASPSYVASYYDGSTINRLDVSGIYTLVSSSRGLLVVDTRDPANPTLSGSYHNSGLDVSAFPSGRLAFLSGTGHGLEIVDFSEPANPALAGFYDIRHNSRGIATSGDYAYSVGFYGLETVDISEPADPIASGQINTSGHNIHLDISGQYAFVVPDAYFMYVFDISDPANPESLTTYTNPSYHYYADIFIQRNYAYLADSYTLGIVDISDPTQPSSIGQLPGFHSSAGLFVLGQYAYLAGQSSGLLVVDVTDPANPAIIGTFDTPGTASDVDVVGNYAYVADGTSGLEVIDVTDPENPILSGSLALTAQARRIAVNGDYAFLTLVSRTIAAVDITEPSSPRLAAEYTMSGYVTDISADSDYIYVANNYSIIILRFNPVTGVFEDIEPPTNYVLHPAYPNPFNAHTTIRYNLPKASSVSIEIFDITGRKIETLQDGFQQGGEHSIVWNGEDRASGVYFYRLKAGGFEKTERCVLLK